MGTGRSLSDSVEQINHVVWTTGGLFVPLEEHERFRRRGRLAMEAHENE